jgi:carbon storage regulator CsrA
MLKLTRKINETVSIITPLGEKIVVTLVQNRGKYVSILGFDAPKNFEILREEATVRVPKMGKSNCA